MVLVAETCRDDQHIEILEVRNMLFCCHSQAGTGRDFRFPVMDKYPGVYGLFQHRIRNPQHLDSRDEAEHLKGWIQQESELFHLDRAF